jgi:hypothetical protein
VNILKVKNSVANSAYCVTNMSFSMLLLITKYSGYHVEEDEMGDACSTYGEDKYIPNFGG